MNNSTSFLNKFSFNVKERNLSRFEIGLYVVIFGLFFSRFMLTLGVIYLLIYSFKTCSLEKALKGVFSQKSLTLYFSIFFLYSFTIFYSDNFLIFFERIRIILPFLILPIVFANPNNKSFNRINLFWFFLILSLMTGFVSFANYLLEFNLKSTYIGDGTLFSTPINHVRYSLFISFAIFIGGSLFFYQRKIIWKIVLLFAISFLVMYLHMLGVRSGLVGFYLVVIYLSLKYILDKKFVRTLILASFIILVYFIFSTCFPLFNYKIKTTKETLHSLLLKKPIKDDSDNGRIASIKAGLEIAKGNFWFGVGLGDLKDELKIYYKGVNSIWEKKCLLPHNQFVLVFSFSGMIGLIWFTFSILYPIFYFKAWKNLLFISFNIILVNSFLFDHTLETQIGVNFYLVFQLILLPSPKTE